MPWWGNPHIILFRRNSTDIKRPGKVNHITSCSCMRVFAWLLSDINEWPWYEDAINISNDPNRLKDIFTVRQTTVSQYPGHIQVSFSWWSSACLTGWISKFVLHIWPTGVPWWDILGPFCPRTAKSTQYVHLLSVGYSNPICAFPKQRR